MISIDNSANVLDQNAKDLKIIRKQAAITLRDLIDSGASASEIKKRLSKFNDRAKKIIDSESEVEAILRKVK